MVSEGRAAHLSQVAGLQSSSVVPVHIRTCVWTLRRILDQGVRFTNCFERKHSELSLLSSVKLTAQHFYFPSSLENTLRLQRETNPSLVPANSVLVAIFSVKVIEKNLWTV